jgi:hypothetical protein
VAIYLLLEQSSTTIFVIETVLLRETAAQKQYLFWCGQSMVILILFEGKLLCVEK